jgi:hypothetical protein
MRVRVRKKNGIYEPVDNMSATYLVGCCGCSWFFVAEFRQKRHELARHGHTLERTYR